MQAVLILAHTGFEQVYELSVLLAGKFEVFIHYDLNTPLSSQQWNRLRAAAHVHCYQKYKVMWAGWSVVAAARFLMEKALEYPEITYVHFISGQDWPAADPQQIYNFYENNNEIYMLYKPAANMVKSGQKCLNWQKFYFVFKKVNRKSIPGRIWHRCLYYLQLFLRIDKLKRYGVTLEIFTGQFWSDIPRDAAQYALAYLDSHEELQKVFKTGFCTDEFWLQTILCNSVYRKDIVQNIHRYIVWEKRNESYPAVLDLSDYKKIAEGDFHFVRKVIRPVSNELIKKLAAF